MSSLAKGTLILTLATAISKILGFIYVVPFTAMVGTQGYILFEYAYKPYALILSFATLGVPLAVSKFVSKHNELGDYATGQKLFRSGLFLLTFTGTVCCVLLYQFAPNIASMLVGENDTTGNSIEDIIHVIQMVSFALIIVPPMAIARGFFQGYREMKPTAYSQVIEQLVRILFILIGAYIALDLFNQSVSFAVGLATFGAFVGAVGGSLVLLWYFKKKQPALKELAQTSEKKPQSSLPNMYKELISYAIPFVIVGLGIPIYQTIDTFTINQALMKTGFTQLEAETVNSVIALVQKIIFIPVSLATALGLTLVPEITKFYVAKEWSILREQINKSFAIISFLTLPCVVLLMALSTPAFSFLFGATHETLGGQLMLWHAPTAILFSLFIVTAAILQGIDRHKFAIFSLLVGLIFKFLSNSSFVMWWEGAGSAISTDIGFLLSILLNVWALKRYAQFKIRETAPLTIKIVCLTLIMAVLVWTADTFTETFFSSLIASNFLETGLRLILWGSLGGLIYGAVSLKTGLLQAALGESIMRKLKLRRFIK